MLNKKDVMKIFFRTLRLILMPFMLLWSSLATPKGVVRPPQAQDKINQECKQLALYHFKTCPFCIKVRHEMARLSLPIALRDAQHDTDHRDDLLKGGGKIQTPCLQITDHTGKIEWLYESGDIISYLQKRFQTA
jgi:glutaredoxin